MSEASGVLTDPTTWPVAEYLVECALPLGASIVKDVGGQTLVLEGRLGLAPQWEHGDCDEDCQQWVSACMLARANVSGSGTDLWLRAVHPAIGTGEDADYETYEASYFGNLFTGERYMCRGSQHALAQAEVAGRTCSVDPASCGVQAYDDCEPMPRCDFVWDDGWTAASCGAEGGPTTEYHAISVYLEEYETDE